MEIKLQRSLKIHRFRVKGTIAKAENRPEIHSFLLLAQEQNGFVSARDVAEKLLGGRPETVGKRLLEQCANYGLLDKQRNNGYALTDKGMVAISQEQIFVHEQGTWELWVTDDPLLPTTLLNIEPFKEPSAHHEKHNAKARNENMKSLPQWLRQSLITDTSLSSLVADNRQYRFINLDDKGEFIADVNANVTATWITPELSQASLVFEGTVDGKKLNYRYQILPKLTFLEIWQQMLEQQNWLQHAGAYEQPEKYWDFQQQALRIPCKNLSNTEQSTFLKNHPFSKPEISDYGRFNDTDIKNIPIMPKDEDAAGGWGFWLLEKKVNDYILAGQFEIQQQNISGLKQFAEFDLIFPEQEEFAQELRNSNPKAYWYLQAPLDWQL